MHSSIVAEIVGNECCIQSQGMSSNHHVQVANGLAGGPQIEADFGVELGRTCIPCEGRDVREEVADIKVEAVFWRKPPKPEEEFCPGDGGEGEFARRVGKVLLKSKVTRFDSVAADICIQQKEFFTHRLLRRRRDLRKVCSACDILESRAPERHC